MPETTLPNHVIWELEEAGVDVGARSVARDTFERLRPPTQSAIIGAGFVVHDELQQRHFEKLTGVDKRDFKQRGGRVVPDRW